MTAAGNRSPQHRATDPSASAWVSANAGSGKTYVLTRRVIRLLIDGCEPSRILCLTFTKAAAAEMANRVFRLLGDWAVMPEAELARALEEVEGSPPDARRIRTARRLFARALETPGGLKIKTIHGFCEALLQRFPVEADLPGRFEVLDDRRALAMRTDARSRAIREASADGDGPLGRALALILSRATDGSVEGVVDAFIARRDSLLAWIGRHASIDAAMADLTRRLGVPEGEDRAGLVAAIGRSPDFDDAAIGAWIAVLETVGAKAKTMADRADQLRAVLAATDPAQRSEIWRAIFLTKDGDPRAKPVTDAVAAAMPGIVDRCAAEAARIVAVERAIAALDTVEMTDAAVRLSDRVIGHFTAAKRAAGVLDFDDLIQRSVSLLSRSDAAAWVQFKLDEGLDHVLVDEAQDTSPLQWRIVEALTDDFFAGRGARGTAVRTVFAVGDEKQSIYSFQGAAPHLFAGSGRRFRGEADASGAGFHDISLTMSYRSTPEVVKAVDAVFADEAAHRGLTRDPMPTVHETNRHTDPGLVEVWPEIEAAPAPDAGRWEDPVDVSGPGSPEVRLATRIADEVAGWLGRGERIAATGQRMRPGDILILVRKRGAFAEAVNRALKARGLPIAGADRLDVLGHIVASDLMAAARVATLPEDDLSLAAFARSPLVPAAAAGGATGLTDEALFAIAHGRDGSLWSAVRDKAAAGDPDAARLEETVQRLLARADTAEPFAFFSAIAGVDGGRAAFRARIGREADEVIDEFLALALAAEEQGAGSLAGFLALAAGSRQDVKREVDAGRDEVRVMTVHGSKGLEAPVVFLVDPGSPPSGGRHDPAVIAIADEPGAALAWVQPGRKPEAVEAAIAAHRTGQEEEYRRLLYVGLTRAADRLVVCGYRGLKSRPDGRWHTLVSSALGPDAEAVQGPEGSVERWIWRCAPERPGKPPAGDGPPAATPAPLPDWLRRPAPRTTSPRALTPSSAAALLAEAEPDIAAASGYGAPDALDLARGLEAPAARRGRLVHRLFEILPDVPPEQRRDRAALHLARSAPDIETDERHRLVERVMAVIEDPRWAAVFGEHGRAEVSLAGAIAVEGVEVPVYGQIDRLVVTSSEVLIVDYKTNRQVPDMIPLAYATQLALYRALMLKIRPGVPVRAAILWTEAPRMDELPAAEMEAIVTRLVTNMGSQGAERPA